MLIFRRNDSMQDMGFFLRNLLAVRTSGQLFWYNSICKFRGLYREKLIGTYI